VHRFHTVPYFVKQDSDYIPGAAQGGDSAYISAMSEIARAADVDLFVPCSRVESVVADAKAGRLMALRTGGKVHAVIAGPEFTHELHDKVTSSCPNETRSSDDCAEHVHGTRLFLGHTVP
jgi:hypothetical protein